MLLTVTKLQRTGANKLEVGSYGKTRKKKVLHCFRQLQLHGGN